MDAGTPPPSSAPKTESSPLPPGGSERRGRCGPDRRQTDRRRGDRRQTDRRLGDRRLGERWGHPRFPVRTETKVLFGLLILCVLLMVGMHWFQSRRAEMPIGRTVVVTVAGEAVYKCRLEELANYFASLDVIQNMQQNPGRTVPEKVRNEQMTMRSQALQENDGLLIERVRKMPWGEFAARAEVAKDLRRGDVPAPTEASRQDALRGAEVE